MKTTLLIGIFDDMSNGYYDQVLYSISDNDKELVSDLCTKYKKYQDISLHNKMKEQFLEIIKDKPLNILCKVMHILSYNKSSYNEIRQLYYKVGDSLVSKTDKRYSVSPDNVFYLLGKIKFPENSHTLTLDELLELIVPSNIEEPFYSLDMNSCYNLIAFYRKLFDMYPDILSNFSLDKEELPELSDKQLKLYNRIASMSNYPDNIRLEEVEELKLK
jgi:predicted house-cleaning noncanonical NTP pyrophosphatase (MazG superfamily)